MPLGDKNFMELYKESKKCCGCTACAAACPREAINMKPDENGFLYPHINKELCVECGLCRRTCSFQNTPIAVEEPLSAYAVMNKSHLVLKASSSGGAFAALAGFVFEKGGIVFGCSYNQDMVPEHSYVSNPIDMKKLQGSKYVQSNINNSYTKAKQFLQEGKWVLFTGTPCQIAGLKAYLGKDYDKLITADLICHGVPSAAFFKDYIRYLEEKLNANILNIKFKDKSKGWGGYLEKVVYEKNGRFYKLLIPAISSYYLSYFLKGDILRESCYECKYAGGSRQGDFTLGDYWGVEKIHPEIQTKQGVSVLLINSKKAMSLVDKLQENLYLINSDYEKAKLQNVPLQKPTTMTENRKRILKLWQEGGYSAVARDYDKSNKVQIHLYHIKRLVPESFKIYLRKIMKT